MISKNTAERSDRARGRIAVTYRAVDSLKPDPKNPRRHDPKQIRQIAASIKAFGFNVPIAVDSNLSVLAGHGRLEAARSLAWKQVPTISLAHLSDAQKRAFMLADNRLTDTSVWDNQLLAENLQELSVLDLDFEIETTGFELPEIELRIESLNATSGEGEDAADDVPALSAKAISKVGDIWLLGPHRVCCGDALDPKAYASLMGDERAAMVFTDPPFNVPIKGHVSGKGKISHREFAMATGEMSEAEFTSFLTRVFGLLAAYSRPGALHFQCMDWRHLAALLAAGRLSYDAFVNLCVWVKGNGGMGSLYRSRHELVAVFKHGKAKHRNNIQLGSFGRNRTNVWEYSSPNAFGNNAEDDIVSVHPTMKPVALVQDAILDCTAKGEIILDSFLGSGTTIIAAEKAGRRGCGLELDPLYVDLIVRRWQSLTGKIARHESSGKAFGSASRKIGRTA